MNRFTVRIHLRSGIVTPLAAETLWGHLCWGVRLRHGEAALESWLTEYDTEQPPLVISDPMPAGFLPAPCLPPSPPSSASTDFGALAEQADQAKSLRKRSWLSVRAWTSVIDDVSPERLSAAVSADPDSTGAELEELPVLHAAINRLTGGTAQEGGGTLFSVPQRYPKAEGASFDVHVATLADAGQVTQWFDDGLIGGYGRDGATGLGQLDIVGVDPSELPACDHPNAAMLLGPCIPRATDPSPAFVHHGVRCGRLGGSFSIGAAPGGTIQKRPVHVLERGSLLSGSVTTPWVGRSPTGVHAGHPGIRQYGHALALPCRVANALLEEANHIHGAALP